MKGQEPHTPGTWHAHGDEIHAEYIDGDGKKHHHTVANAVVLSDAYGNIGTAEGNAARIAVAVNAHADLLMACREALGYLSDYQFKNGSGMHLREYIQKAIAIAEKDQQ